MELFDKVGNFTVPLKLHIIRYAEENGIEPKEVISKMMLDEIPLKTWCFWSLSGYKSYEAKINMIDKSMEK